MGKDAVMPQARIAQQRPVNTIKGEASNRDRSNEGAMPIDTPRDRPSHRNCVSTAGQWMAVLSRS
jgi:hypothetical protein